MNASDIIRLTEWDNPIRPGKPSHPPTFQFKFVSTNKEWGFYGAIKRQWDLSDDEAAEVFQHMGNLILKMIEKSVDDIASEVEHARDFLDTKWGRHLADYTTNAKTHGKYTKENLDSILNDKNFNINWIGLRWLK